MAFCCTVIASSSFCTSVSSLEDVDPLGGLVCAAIKPDKSTTKRILCTTRIELFLLSFSSTALITCRLELEMSNHVSRDNSRGMRRKALPEFHSICVNSC